MRTLLISAASLVIGLAGGIWLMKSDSGQSVAKVARERAVELVVESASLGTRERIMLEHPEMLAAISRGGSFGGKHSAVIAMDLFTTSGPGIEEAKKLSEIIEVAPRTWLIRLPIVNAALFETDDGLVLVDTGMGVGGPAILDLMRQVSDKPLHTIIYTHGHVDHAYGTWALMEAGTPERPIEVIAQDKLPTRFDRYIRMRGSLANYMSQKLDSLPDSRDDLVYPTRTFSDRLELEIGGETFVLQHREGETDDQLFVWVPSRKALASADYYQGFLPNAGNGKRMQRNIEEWAFALREMANLGAEVLLPAHGAEITDPALISENLNVLAEALEFILNHTISGLNAGLRKDQIADSVELPEHLANHPTLRIQYVTPADISKMVMKRYTGWWDDVPSNWTPAPREAQGEQIARLAGGIDMLVAEARGLIETDVVMACHLTDWAFLAAPENPDVQQLVIDVYRARVLDPRSNTMEMLNYVKVMTEARELQLVGNHTASH
ncbi:MAG: alkyl sulfatase dimerization domain-containing protein [Myxococcota bacterium]|nr:alkyl sulfatase dimerization domain-containing protein [Myxococcota bacterium]